MFLYVSNVALCETLQELKKIQNTTNNTVTAVFRESEIFFDPSNFYMPEKSLIATIQKAYVQIRLVSIGRITKVFQNRPFSGSGTLK